MASSSWSTSRAFNKEKLLGFITTLTNLPPIYLWKKLIGYLLKIRTNWKCLLSEVGMMDEWMKSEGNLILIFRSPTHTPKLWQIILYIYFCTSLDSRIQIKQWWLLGLWCSNTWQVISSIHHIGLATALHLGRRKASFDSVHLMNSQVKITGCLAPLRAKQILDQFFISHIFSKNQGSENFWIRQMSKIYLKLCNILRFAY